MNNKKFNNIVAALDRAEDDKNKELSLIENERAQIAAKIAELENKKENAVSLEEFKTISAALKSENENLSFLSEREKTIKKSVLDNDTARSYQETIINELTALKENAAENIQPVFFDMIAKMNSYCKDYLIGVELLERIRKTNNYHFNASKQLGVWTISEINPDSLKWWPEFCYFFFRYYNEAARIEKRNKGRENG